MIVDMFARLRYRRGSTEKCDQLPPGHRNPCARKVSHCTQLQLAWKPVVCYINIIYNSYPHPAFRRV